MARISTGDFGFTAPQPAQGADTSAIGRAVEGLGGELVRTGLILNEKRQQAARSESANAYLDHQIAVQSIGEEISDELTTGKLVPDDAAPEYQRRVAKLKRPEIAHLTSIDQQYLDRGIERSVFQGSKAVDKNAEIARRVRFQANFDSALDKLGKLSGAPGADIEGINQQADALKEMGMAAGYNEATVSQAIQNFKDRNWQNDAVRRAMESAESLKGLKQLKHDLTAEDGYYAGKLDVNARNAILRGVLADEQQLRNRLEHESDRREAKAGVAMTNMARQVASGVPATAQMWADWEKVVAGTSFAPEFKSMLKSEAEVQEVLGMAPAAQIKYAQDKESALMSGGGTLQEAANVERIKAAVKENVNLLEQAPLVFNGNRNGEPPEPLDLSSIGNPESTEFAKQLQERVVTLGAMRKQYGPQVPMKPLLPQEAAVLSSALNEADARKSALLFAGLRQAVGDDEAYVGIMQQIAPDNPVKSYVGVLASKQRSVTLERNWTSSNVVATSPDVGMTMLRGLEVLRPTKNAKGEDGSPKVALYLPNEAEKDLQRKFADELGEAFAGREDDAQNAYQAMRAYYVGRQVEKGHMAGNSQEVASEDVKQSVIAALGEVVDYNDNGEVLAPWGMSAGDFKDKVEDSFLAELKKRGLPLPPVGQLDHFGLRNRGASSYYVTLGRTPVLDAKGQPLVISVGP